jgi:protein phosphatase
MSFLHISASSRTGCVRTNNEDMGLVDDVLVRNETFSETFETTPDNRLMLALADGMGGHNCGEVASNDTLTNLRFFFRDLPATLDNETFCQSMRDWLKSICMLIDSKGKSHEVYQGMGTTLVGLIYFSGRYYWINCGDSRLYRLHDGVLQQLTTDHSLSNVLGLSTHSSQIVNCIGGGSTDSYLDIECITDEVEAGDVFMLCTDGLTDMIGDSHVRDLLKHGVDADKLCEAAEEAGGYDNVSVIVVKVTEE